MLTSLLLQLHSFIYIYIAFKRNLNEKLITYYATRRNNLRRKVRHLKMRKLSRKRHAAWVNNGRTEKLSLNMITGVSPDHEWRKNCRMTREKFCILCERKGSCGVVSFERHRISVDDRQHFWNSPMYCFQP